MEKAKISHLLNTADLAAGALHLFESNACKNQGLIYVDRVVALQFHPEVNGERIQSLINRFVDGIVDAWAGEISGWDKGVYVYGAG
jgi:GMP synthase-like glutamine amidotransferase